MSSADASKKVPIALQLFSVRHACKEDFAGTLSAVAKMGYDGVEFAGYYDTPAGELRKMLDDLGLEAAGTHIGLPTLEGDELARTVEFNRTIGNDFLVVPGLPAERRESAEAWSDAAKLLEEIAGKVAGDGMWVGCHNHAVEFEDFDGRTAWDILYGSTEKVVMQMDIGNALHAGAEPLAFMKKYPGRQQSTHLKEHSADKDWPIVGDGDVDWAAVFDFCESAGDTRWYVVEFENEAYPALESVEKCLAFLRGMGK
ncbi:hypothetical protein LCGC14_1464340 [marine sediment metagenome]|uniref:Xylose isomerase-like TIM barrel domain-containing protein n=1 Tax=marine sediment metagenome TaxID=412755 RepID=A0A0F9LUQ3_9ZZZZ